MNGYAFSILSPELHELRLCPRWLIQDGRHLTIMMLLQRRMTSSLFIADPRGNTFGTIHLPSAIFIACMLAKLWWACARVGGILESIGIFGKTKQTVSRGINY